jgi:hypothetical protein
MVNLLGSKMFQEKGIEPNLMVIILKLVWKLMFLLPTELEALLGASYAHSDCFLHDGLRVPWKTLYWP